MKETKFRAWERDKNTSATMGGFMHYSDNTINNLVGFFKYYQTYIKENLMQFIGLKDKNQKDIFEGDILRFYVDEGFDDGEYLGEVVFVNDCFSIKISDQRKNPKVNDLYKYDIGQIPDVCEFEKCEVIGNIYQNPTLLTFSKE